MRLMRRTSLTILLLLFLILPCEAFKLAVGTYTGNGANDRDITISPAFQPVFCMIRGVAVSTQNRWVVRYGTYTGDQSNILTGSTGALLADYIQAFNADGFQIGTNARVNENTKVYYYLCLGTDGANDLSQGTYTAAASPVDGTDIVISPAFQPGLVILSGDTQNGVFRIASNSGDASLTFDGNAVLANMIQAFNVDGFEIGTHARVQSANIAYDYVAIKAGASGFFEGTYTTNNTDGRQITTLTQQPEFLGIKLNSTAQVSARFDDQIGDLSFTGINDPAANIIQAFLSNGFELGTDASVNGTGSLAAYWFGLSTPPASSGSMRRRF